MGWILLPGKGKATGYHRGHGAKKMLNRDCFEELGLDGHVLTLRRK